jgi:hypothetical protein
MPTKEANISVNPIEVLEKMAKKLKTLTDPNADFRKTTSTDEKAYPTMEAVPKCRQSARWECCWPQVAPGGPRQASPPSRSRPYHRAGPIGVRLIRPADLPTCRIWSRITTGLPARATSPGSNSSVASTFNSEVECFDSCRASRPIPTFRGLSYFRCSPMLSLLGIIFHSSNPSSRWM